MFHYKSQWILPLVGYRSEWQTGVLCFGKSWCSWGHTHSPLLPRTPQHRLCAALLTWSSLLQAVCWWCLWSNSWLKSTTPQSRPPWRDCAATCQVNMETGLQLRAPSFFLWVIMGHHGPSLMSLHPTHACGGEADCVISVYWYSYGAHRNENKHKKITPGSFILWHSFPIVAK